MKIIFRIKALLILFILMTNIGPAQSQVVVERSNEKAIISGNRYYVHRVKKGETAYSISKAYGIKVEELIKENPPAVYGLNEGQVLKIPVRPIPEKAATEPSGIRQKDETKYIYHTLKPGETVFYLSKSYGISENEIIQSNPGIEINKLPVGTEIAVPRRDFMIEKEKFIDQEQNYVFHKVVQGETLASIAEKYGLSLRDLRRENRNLRFPAVGDFVRIPKSAITITQKVEKDTIEPVAEVPEENVIRERPVGYTPVNNLNGTLDVAVLLPFYFKENSVRATIDSSKSLKGRKIYKTVNMEEGWIYPESLYFIEMFEGILLAADTLRSLGLNINLYPYDIKNDTVELSKLISSRKLEEMDLIIGPVYSYNLSKIASYAKNFDIPVVSPVPLLNNTSLAANRTLFMSFSSLATAQRTLAKRISENYDHNLVFIHSDTSGTERDVKNFRSAIFSELTDKIHYEDIRFKELIFYNRSKFGIDSINRLSHALSDQVENTVIIASEDPAVISETLMDIHGLSKRFKVNVFGYPFMRSIENLDPKYFFDLSIMLYTPYWIDYSKKDVKQFNADFRQKFLTEPDETSYAWQGYDLTYYFLSGIAIHGKDFIAHPEIHNPDLLQTEFDFRRSWPDDGFENQKLFLIHYTKDYDVKLIDEVRQ
jgi:LysM repeat protein